MLKERKPTISSTYLIMRERPEKHRGFFEVITAIRTTLSSFSNDEEFARWLFDITSPLMKEKRLRDGDHIYIVRTQAKGERKGYHKIVQGRLTREGFIYYDRCNRGTGHKGAKAIPAQPWSNQPHWQKPEITAGFMSSPPAARFPFTPRFLRQSSFL